jgi:hypothetical protein
MYCHYCANKVNTDALEAKAPSLEKYSNVVNSETKVTYVCPRCGHIIKEDLGEDEIKSLSRAAHAEYLRGSNRFSTGMSLTLFGSILLIIGFVFFLLSFKADAGGNLVPACAEFIVCIALTLISVILLGFGITFVVRGLTLKRQCSVLLKDINNQTFVQ